MSLSRDFSRVLLPCVALLGSLLAACGTDEYSPSHAKTGTPAEETESLAYKDPNDFSTASIELTTSGQRNPELNTVEIFALVKDQLGNPLIVLNKQNFGVTLDPMSAPRIVETRDITLSTAIKTDRLVALVIDSSGSMSAVDPTSGLTRIQAGKNAAKLYVDNMVDGDFAAVVTFSSTARTVQALTDDKTLLRRAIDSLQADGATNFGGAIGEAVQAVGTRPGKRAMILLTDGDDTVDTVTGGPSAWLNNPQSSRYQGLTAAQRNTFRIYTVGLGTDLSETGLADLATFADQTGGSFFQAATTDALATPFSRTIPDEIAALPEVETYVLSFANPYTPKPGRTANISYGVSVTYMNGNGLLADYRTGAYQVP